VAVFVLALWSTKEVMSFVANGIYNMVGPSTEPLSVALPCHARRGGDEEAYEKIGLFALRSTRRSEK